MTRNERMAEQLDLVAKSIEKDAPIADAATVSSILDDFVAMLRDERSTYGDMAEVGICPESECWVCDCEGTGCCGD